MTITHAELVQVLREHPLTDRRELGHTRRVCATCGTDGGCPDVAQAREDAVEAGLDLLAAADEARA